MGRRPETVVYLSDTGEEAARVTVLERHGQPVSRYMGSVRVHGQTKAARVTLLGVTRIIKAHRHEVRLVNENSAWYT